MVEGNRSNKGCYDNWCRYGYDSVKTKAETVDYAEIEVKKNEILSDLSFNRQSIYGTSFGLVALFSYRYRSLNR